jgi:putative membrane protein
VLKSILIKWVVLAIAVGATTWLLPGLNFTGDLWTLLLMSAVLGLLMAVLKPILMLLTCPLVLLTLGLFTLVINTFILYVTSWIFPESFTIDNFWWALLASIIISVIAMILNSILGEE